MIRLAHIMTRLVHIMIRLAHIMIRSLSYNITINIIVLLSFVQSSKWSQKHGGFWALLMSSPWQLVHPFSCKLLLTRLVSWAHQCFQSLLVLRKKILGFFKFLHSVSTKLVCCGVFKSLKNTLHYHKKFARGAIKKSVEVMYFLANISKVFICHRYVYGGR